MLKSRVIWQIGRAYFWLYRARANVHWMAGSALGFVPVAAVLVSMQFSWFPHLEVVFKIALIFWVLWGFGFVASRNGLSLTLGKRLELKLHLPRAFLVRYRARTAEAFLICASETILWARRMGFRTVVLESPLLHGAKRRSNVAADLQLMCGDKVIVTSILPLRRLTFLGHHAFMLQRRPWWNAPFSKAPSSFLKNLAVPARRPDGLARDPGRLMSGKIVVSFPLRD